MNLNVKQFRKELTTLIARTAKEIDERHAAIKHAEATLKMIDSFDANTNGHRAKIQKAKPKGAVGITEAIFKVLSPESGTLIGGVIEKVSALKPYSNSADLPRTITATVAGLQRREAIKRKKTKEGWAYFRKAEKPAKSPAQAAA